MASCDSLIGEGCKAVIIAETFEGERRSYYVVIGRNGVYTTIAGIVRASQILGEKWGVTIKTRIGRIAVVKPTLVEYMENFYRRATQVVYPKDAGLIALLAGLRPGSRVLEAGVGSGFLTTVLALHVCPEGSVYGFDVKKSNLEIARSNLRSVGLDGCVRLRRGDVRRPETLEEVPELDAAVLDMPDPWEALDSIYSKLQAGSPLIVFVPTMNQLDKLLNSLGDKWILQEALEVAARRIDMRREAIRPGPWVASFTGYIVVLRKVLG